MGDEVEEHLDARSLEPALPPDGAGLEGSLRVPVRAPDDEEEDDEEDEDAILSVHFEDVVKGMVDGEEEEDPPGHPAHPGQHRTKQLLPYATIKKKLRK